MQPPPGAVLAQPSPGNKASSRPLMWRVFWRGLPWTAPVVFVYASQVITSFLMGGEWNTSLVVLQALVVAAFVAVFYALTLAKERERMDPS